MAKKKKAQATFTSNVVSDWKRQNEERLQDIQNTNPALFSGIVQALNYLSGSLGGSAVIEEKIEEQQTVSEVPLQKRTLLTKELLEGTFIRVRDFNQFLLIQGIVMKLGYEYHPMLLPVYWQPNEIEEKFSIKSLSDVDDWQKDKGVKITNVRYNEIIGIILQQSNDGLYVISMQFAADEHILDGNLYREINLIDLGLEQSVIDQMSLESTKAWIGAHPQIHRRFQSFVMSKGYEMKSIVSFTQPQGYGMYQKPLWGYYDQYDDTDGAYSWETETPISPRQFNLEIPWVLDDFMGTKCAILNSKRDLPQLRNFFENLKSFTGGKPKVYADPEIDSWCYVTINDKAEVYFVKWDSSVSYNDLQRKEFTIGDLGLPLIAPEAFEQKGFPYLYDKVKLPTTLRGKSYDVMGQAGRIRYSEINQRANDVGVDAAYVVGIEKDRTGLGYSNDTTFKLAVFTKRSSLWFDAQKKELELGIISQAAFEKLIERLLKDNEAVYTFDKYDLKPYETSPEVEIGMNIPAKSEKNVSLEDQKLAAEDTDDLEDELDNIEI